MMLRERSTGCAARARTSEHQGVRGLPGKRSTEHMPRQRRVGRGACLPPLTDHTSHGPATAQVTP